MIFVELYARKHKRINTTVNQSSIVLDYTFNDGGDIELVNIEDGIVYVKMVAVMVVWRLISH